MGKLMQHLKTTVVLESVGEVHVSTVNLFETTPFWRGMETCIFYGREGRESVVVESYGNWQEAVKGHANWSNAVRLAQFLTHHVRLS